MRTATVSDDRSGLQHAVAVADTDDLVLRVVEINLKELTAFSNLKPGDPVDVFIDFTASRAGKPVGIIPVSQGEIKEQIHP
ncbi:MAG: hypothetical protein HYW64_01460 [Candidatus Levybacteria bacterium]|nr:hypothetical protein [Candidatus Levybacteria bacterium]